MKELLKEAFEIHCRMRWLKEIDRANRKAVRLREKTIRQNAVVRGLAKRYNELYPTDQIILKVKEE